MKQKNQNNKNKRQQYGDEVKNRWRTFPKEKLLGKIIYISCISNEVVSHVLLIKIELEFIEHLPLIEQISKQN